MTPSDSAPSLSANHLTVPSQFRRKFSIPISLQPGSLLSESAANSARRRLSNVGDVFSRKLSSTIGWKHPVPVQDILSQGKCLCGQYIRCRLKRSGIYNRKLGLQRIRSILGTSHIHVVREVFPALLFLGEELESMHPRIYTGIARQISRSPGGELKNPETISILLSTIARDLFKSDITWSKVVSLFAICGGLAIDCVRQGHVDYLPQLVDSFSEVVEDELVNWIHENGGWVGMSNKVVSPESDEFTMCEWIAIGIISLIALIASVLILRLLGQFFFPNAFPS